MRLRFAVVAAWIFLTLISEGIGQINEGKEPMRLVHFFGKTCTEPLFQGAPMYSCVPGSECQMMPVTPCLADNCRSPFCVRSVDLPPITSLVDNYGRCPYFDTSDATISGEVFCSDDTSCAIYQKCCLNGSNIECVKVASTVSIAMYNTLAILAYGPPKPSAVEYCPNINVGDFAPDCSDGQPCNLDANCPGRQKCCVAGNGKLCVNPISIITALILPTVPVAEFDTDYSKRGTCSSVSNDFVLVNNTSCRDDFDCNGNEKCCALPQGFGCLPPNMNYGLAPQWPASYLRSTVPDSPSLSRIRGQCPTASSSSNTLCGETCVDDTNCPLGMLCCQHAAGMECVNPVINDVFKASRYGLCPTFASDVNYSSGDDCNVDAGCSIPDMKCCRVGVRDICMNPVSILETMLKAGTCPDPNTVTSSGPSTCPICPKVPATQGPATQDRLVKRQLGSGCQTPHLRNKTCRSDADCTGSQKCCTNLCGGFSCADPI